MKKPPDIFKKYIGYLKKIKISDFKYIPILNDFYTNFFFDRLNNQFNNIVCKIRKDDYNEYTIMPSLIKDYQNNFKPFWNDQIKALSNKIYMPSFYNTHITLPKRKELSNTWFNHRLVTGFHNNYKLKFTNTVYPMESVINTRQILLKLTENQKRIMKIIIGCYRYFYNRAIEYANNLNVKTRKSYFYVDRNNENSKKKITVKKKGNLYSMTTIREYLKKYYPEWIPENLPSHLIDKAIDEAMENVKTNIKKYQKTKKPFKMKFKSKKDIKQTINLEKTMISKINNTIFSGFKHEGERPFKNINSSELFNKYDFLDSSLSYNRILSKWTLNLSFNKEVKYEIPENKICSIDPGEVIFATIYTDDKVIEIGKEARHILHKKCREVDIINSRMNRKEYYTKNKETNEKQIFIMNSNRKRNLRKALHKKIEQIKNLRNELHNKTINYLVKNYSKIILPLFEAQEMTMKLNSKVARSLNTLCHYKFKEKLKNKCYEKGIELKIVNEAYTSKTCTNCGNIQIINGRIYECKKCGIIVPRDNVGARNIMLKNIWNC